MLISVRNFSLGCSLCEYLAYISQHLHWQCVRRSPGPRSGHVLVPQGLRRCPQEQATPATKDPLGAGGLQQLLVATGIGVRCVFTVNWIRISSSLVNMFLSLCCCPTKPQLFQTRLLPEGAACPLRPSCTCLVCRALVNISWFKNCLQSPFSVNTCFYLFICFPKCRYGNLVIVIRVLTFLLLSLFNVNIE